MNAKYAQCYMHVCVYVCTYNRWSIFPTHRFPSLLYPPLVNRDKGRKRKATTYTSNTSLTWLTIVARAASTPYVRRMAEISLLRSRFRLSTCGCFHSSSRFWPSTCIVSGSATDLLLLTSAHRLMPGTARMSTVLAMSSKNATHRTGFSEESNLREKRKNRTERMMDEVQMQPCECEKTVNV